MRKLFVALTCFFPVFFLGSSCPSPEQFPPPPLSAPAFIGKDLTAAKFDVFRPAIHLTWKAPSADSVAIREYVILSRSDDSAGFATIVRSIPDTVFDYYDNIDRIAVPAQNEIKPVYYRIFAIDTLGRNSDTSSIDSVMLSWPPKPLFPLMSDSMQPDSVVFTLTGVMGGYFPYIFLCSDSLGIFWKSPKPDTPTYSYADKTDRFIVNIPKNISFMRGSFYYWAVKVEIPTGNSQAIAISRFYVP